MLITAAALAVAFKAPAAVTVKLAGKIVGLKPLAYAAAPSGAKFAVTLENNEVRIVDPTTKQTTKKFVGHPQPAYAVAWSKDGTFLASGDESARIFIWNATTGEKTKTIIGHIRGIGKLSFNNSRTLLASTGKDDVINVWNVSNGKKAAEVKGNGLNLYGGTFRPVGDVLLSGTLGGGGRTYTITGSGAQIGNFFLSYTNPGGQLHGMLDVDWAPDGTKMVSAGNDNNAIVWDMKGLKRLGVLKGHQDWVMHAAFSPNSQLIATSSTDRTVKIWDAKTLTLVTTLENQSAIGAPLSFTADGKYLLTAGIDDNIEFYSLAPAQAGKPVPAKVTKPVKKRRKGG